MPRSKTLKFIAIDDDPLAIMWLEELLEMSGIDCSLESYNDSVAGAKALQTKHPDLLFLDIEMPKLTGLDILKLPIDLPSVVAMSSNTKYEQDVLELNAKVFLQKPLTLGLINDLFSSSLNLKQA